jgi:HAE1 family hydrophobic/amphiphilic exporter-1
MLENIVRHVEQGETPFEAAIKGAREIGFTIVSMTHFADRCFIPVLFMRGIVGRLLHEFAVTICAAILVSGLRLADPDADAMQPLPQARRAGFSTAASSWPSSAFSTPCSPPTERRSPGAWRTAVVMLSFVATLALTALLFASVPKDFLPSGDSGGSSPSPKAPRTCPSPAMMQRQRALAEIVAQEPDIHPGMSASGPAARGPTANTGTLVLMT